MAEQIYREQFGNVAAVKVCTNSIDLNFDNFIEPGKYDIYEDCVDGRICIYSLLVDKSSGADCVRQTRTHEGSVDTRCYKNGIWSPWELISGNGGGGVSPNITLHDVANGVEIIVEDADGKETAIVRDGEPGGYYIPSFAQSDERTVFIVLNGSKASMPIVKGEKIILPKGERGREGGYYIPMAEDKGNGTVEISFEPSEAGMPSLGSVEVQLPSGGYYSPYIVQSSLDSFMINWTPSQEGMPGAFPQTVVMERENFVADYQKTTWKDINDAYNAGKHIYAKAGTNVYVLFSISQTTATFSRAQQSSIDYVRITSEGIWSSSSKAIVAKEDFDALVARVAALEGN